MMRYPTLSLLGALLLALPVSAQEVEHRGLWVGGGTFNTPEQVAAIVDQAAKAHLNALYPLVWYHGGQAWYKSTLSPLAKNVAPDYDPLGHMIELAHARGIDVHAWFVNGSYGSPSGGGVFDQHPDWELQPARKAGQRWYDLANPEVRRFQTDVMIECLRNYDLDGLHFDYIRYADTGTCYCERCQQEFTRLTGLPPLSRDRATLPVALELRGNPLARPTTARVLATFDDGSPAVTLNECGKGQAALINWVAATSDSPVADAILAALLKRFNATTKNVFQLRTSQTAAKYNVSYQTEGANWLKALGFSPRVIDETKLGEVESEGVLTLFGQYNISEETAAQIEQFVSGGGRAIFVDGPVFGIKHPALQRVLGMGGTGGYFSEFRAVNAAPGQDLLPVGPPVDVEMEKQRQEKWVAYRKSTVTELVRSVHQEAKRVKPQAQVSAAVFYNRQAAEAVCQDWYGWLKEGIIDYVLPMAYLMENSKLQEALDEWKAADPQFERIIPGLSIYMRGEKITSRPPDLVLSQAELCRKAGARGTLFFASNYLNDELAEALAAGPYAQRVEPYYPKKRP